jgi:hypothetical protein
LFLADGAVGSADDLPRNPTLAARHLLFQTMDGEKTIIEIELLERIYALPDKRPLRMLDWKAANKKHDETYANNPWFRLWKQYGGSAPSRCKPRQCSYPISKNILL